MNQFTNAAANVSPAGEAAETPWIGLARGKSFLLNEETRIVADRALSYARAGLCVHLRGMAGLGKTSLAFHLAEALGRPVSFLAGNEWLTTSDFVGREIGQSSVTVVDKYVQSVRRTETMSRSEWKDSVLSTAMERGHTLVYDEFTRASPEANATLLSVLEEGVLVFTDQAAERSHIKAHSCFRIILTSNPHDYVGVNSAPDALLDRVVTLDIREPSTPTLTAIVAMRSGLETAIAGRIVRMIGSVRTHSENPALSSIRAAIMIARVAAFELRFGPLSDARLAVIASDVLGGRGAEIDAASLAALLMADPAA